MCFNSLIYRDTVDQLHQLVPQPRTREPSSIGNGRGASFSTLDRGVYKMRPSRTRVPRLTAHITQVTRQSAGGVENRIAARTVNLDQKLIRQHNDCQIHGTGHGCVGC